ncbi:hypothetical protein ABIC15_002429, partial [Exiguobacterium sp. PvP048]
NAAVPGNTSAAAMAVAANFFVFFILSHPLKFRCLF